VRRLTLALLSLSLLGGCRHDSDDPRWQVAGGDPDRGRAAIEQYGCGSCHLVPGVNVPGGAVGPPLAGFARRAYVAGRLPNVPDSLVQWLMNPQRFEPGRAMPNLGVTEKDARDIAAYLYTLQ
jgi:cytochrome c